MKLILVNDKILVYKTNSSKEFLRISKFYSQRVMSCVVRLIKDLYLREDRTFIRSLFSCVLFKDLFENGILLTPSSI